MRKPKSLKCFLARIVKLADLSVSDLQGADSLSHTDFNRVVSVVAALQNELGEIDDILKRYKTSWPPDAAAAFAHDLMQNIAVGHPDEITADWLMIKHPTLSKKEAEKYRLFCKQKTIVFRACYGDGEIMWPKWVASN